MSKKILCMLLLTVMILPMLAGCTTPAETQTPDAGATGTTVTATPDTTEKETPTPTPTPTPEPTPLPSSSSLLGTKHVPPIDSQGSIGSCSSQSVTYTQFTIAVSQYVNNVMKNTEWDPSSGNKNYIFSPKSTFVYSGAGTQYNYDILTDQGALPLSLSTFKKSGEASINDDPLSRSWDSAKGVMAKALRYRLSNYEEVEFDSYDYDFKTERGQLHLERIKRAIYEGNAVSVCGWSSYWEYTKVENPGTLARVGDGVIWAGWKYDGQSDGNHAVAFVGYDDEITVTVSGVKMKGAFLVANSWGSSYHNNGYVWMMYDSLNRVSEYDAFAEDGFYTSNPTFVSTDGAALVKPSYSAKENNQLTYTKTAAKKTVEGKEYPVYNISENKNGKFLGYDNSGKMVWLDAVDNTCDWVIIPSADFLTWNGFEGVKSTTDKANYDNAFLLCAANRYTALASPCFIQIAKDSPSNAGKEVSLAAVKAASIDKFACSLFRYKEDAEKFSCALRANYVEGATVYERTGTLYRTSFVYWDKDVLIDQPNVIVEVEVDVIKRESLSVTLIRSDKAGNTITREPQIIYNNLRNTTAMAVESWNTRFDGNESDGTYNKGYIAFGFNDLAMLEGGFKYEDLLWGVTVKGNNLGVKVCGLRLLDLDGNVLSEIKVNEEYAEIGKGESRSFWFDLGSGIKDYVSVPGMSTVLYNKGAEKYLGTGSVSIPLSNTFDEEALLNFVKLDADNWEIQNPKKNWLLDIKGKVIEEGAVVKYNIENKERNTQTWKIEQLEDNTFMIRLAADPEYFVSYDKSTSKLILTKTKDSTGYYKWQALSMDIVKHDIKVVAEDNKLVISGVVPEGYTSGNIDIKITNADGTYNTVSASVAPEKGEFKTTIDKLPAGTYIFSAVNGGTVYGFQYIYTVK